MRISIVKLTRDNYKMTTGYSTPVFWQEYQIRGKGNNPKFKKISQLKNPKQNSKLPYPPKLLWYHHIQEGKHCPRLLRRLE